MSDAPLPPSAQPPEAPAPAPAAASAPAPVPAAPAPTPVVQDGSADVAATPVKPLLNPLQQNGPPPSSTIVEPPRSPMPVDPASSVASPSVNAPSAAPAPAGAGGSDAPRLEGTATPAPAPPASEDKPPLPTDAPVPPSPQPPKDEEPPTLPSGAIPSAVPTPTVILTEEQALASGSAPQSQPQPPVSPAPPPPATPATPSVPPAAVQAPSEPVPAPSATAFPAADANAMDVDADGDADAQGEEDDGPVQPADSGNLKRPGDELSGREEKRAKEEPQAGSSTAPAPAPAAPAPVYIPGTPHPEYAPAKYDENLPTSALTQAQHKHLLATVRSLKKNPFAFAFLAPVDPVMLNIPHYPTVVKNPMDLGTVETKLIVSDPRGPPKDKSKAKNWDESKGRYSNVLEVARDVRQIWENTRMFNGPNHDVSLNANKLDAIFEKGLKSLPTDRPAPVAGSPAGQPAPRRPSFAGAPAIRRSLDGTEQRPKREIHPPPNKDVGYEPTRKPKRRNDPQLAWVAKQFRTLENKQYEAITSPFWYPVEQLIATIPLYSEIIKQPIDLNIIRQRFNDSYYENVDSALADVQLVWDNAMKYNRPGDAFHNAATDCMRLWNDKMKAMPPKELPRQESEDPLAEEFDDSEGEDSATIKELEDKIDAMQKQIEAIRAKRAAKRNGAKQKPKGGAAARRQSVSKAAGSAATNGNAGGAAYGQPQAKRPRKNKDAPAYGGADDEDSDSSNITYLTLAQKQRLASAMDSADAETIAAAMQLIKSAMDITDDEIEVDLEQVPLSCAIKLYKLVVLRKGPRAPRGSKKNAAAAGRKGPGGTRKRMNEQEEADRIRRMEEQLQSFDAGAKGSYGGPAAHAYDDSDESSDEGESDDE